MISRLRGSERMVPHISAADSARERGNKAFIDSDYATAVAHYSEALNQYDDNEAEARVKTYTNRAMAHDKLGNTGMAIADCDAALALNSSWTKARYRRMCLCAAHQEWARVSSDGEALLSADSGLKPSELTHLRALMKEAEAAQRTDAHNPGHETSSSDATISASNVTTDESGPSDSDDDDDEQNGAIGAVTTQVHKLSFSPGSADATSVHPAFAVAAANNNSSNNSSASPRIEEEEKEVSNPDGDVGNSIKGSGNGNGSSSGSGEGPRAGLCGACGKDAKSLCKRCNHTVYCSRSCQHAHWKFHKAFCTRGAPDPSPQLTMQTRRGLVGLYNAGNSCYLNSAVACLSHCYPLTRHLISGRFTAELNRANALGSKGLVTEALAALLQRLWFGDASAVDARSLKRAIDGATDSFAGLAQHDSAEFLTFVLDMVHEDLNRVQQRAYVELPDPGPRPDAEVAQELWQLHTKRNDSVVTDHFSGVYKSVVTCPNCHTPWRKFDPFTTVELPLPLRSSRSVRVTVVRRVAGAFPQSTGTDGDDEADAAEEAAAETKEGSGTGKKNGKFRAAARSGTSSTRSQGGSHSTGGASLTAALSAVPVVYAVEVNQKTLVGELLAQVAKMSGVPADQLFAWEAYNGQFHQRLLDNFPTFRLAATDNVVFTELPDAEWASNPTDDTGLLEFTTPAPPSEAAVEASEEDVEFDVFTCAVLHRAGPDPSRAHRQAAGAAGAAAVGNSSVGGGARKQAVATFFDQPLVLMARRQWTVGGLKRHLLAQVAHWFTAEETNKEGNRNVESSNSGGGGSGPNASNAALSPPDAKAAKKAQVLAQLAKLRADEARASAAMGMLAGRLKLALVDQTGAPIVAASARDQPLADPFYQRSLELDRLTLAEALPSVKPQGHCFLALEWDDKSLAVVEAAVARAPRVLHPSVAALAPLEAGLTLASCFESFCKEEQMAPGEEYYCGKCQDHVRGTKAMRLAKCPDVLVLTLKRFSKQLGFAGRFLPAKVQDLVTFPINHLDVSPYLLSPDADDQSGNGDGNHSPEAESTIYDLFACVNHYGHANGGHYKAAVRRVAWTGVPPHLNSAPAAPAADRRNGAKVAPSQGQQPTEEKWFDYDDETVTEITNPESVVSKAAYVLFYRRRTQGP